MTEAQGTILIDKVENINVMCMTIAQGQFVVMGLMIGLVLALILAVILNDV